MTEEEYIRLISGKSIDSNKTPLGQTNGKQVPQEEEEQLIDGGFFEDMWTSIMQGWSTGTSVDEAFDVYKKGSSLTDDELQNYIEAAENINKYGPTNEQIMYQKAVKENGGGFFGWAKAVADNFGYAPQAIATSLATMIGRCWFRCRYRRSNWINWFCCWSLWSVYYRGWCYNWRGWWRYRWFDRCYGDWVDAYRAFKR